MILAEVDPQGSLYACGSVNWAIGAIFLGSILVPLLLGTLVGRFTNLFVGFVVAMLLVFVAGPLGWQFAAMLSEGSCG